MLPFSARPRAGGLFFVDTRLAGAPLMPCGAPGEPNPTILVAGGINYQSWLFMRTFIDRLSFRTRVVLVICTVLTTYVVVIFQFPS